MMSLAAPGRQRGFTIIEVLVTVVLVSILASIALPLSAVVTQRNKELELRRALREIRGALDAYKRAVTEGRIALSQGGSGYPKDLETLQLGSPDIKSASGARLQFLRRIPRDPFFADSSVASADTWGKRSYASSAEAPQEGADVFDVYSLAPGVGLNGIAYREW